MRQPETGVVITPSQNVKVVAHMNPRMLALLTGEIDVEDLDDEELAKGMCRDGDGKFPKTMPNVVPRDMYKRMTQVLFERADKRIKSGLEKAVESIVKIATSDEVTPAERLKAATWLIERTMGKTPEVVQVSQEKPYEKVLTKVHRGPRSLHRNSPAHNAPGGVSS